MSLSVTRTFPRVALTTKLPATERRNAIASELDMLLVGLLNIFEDQKIETKYEPPVGLKEIGRRELYNALWEENGAGKPLVLFASKEYVGKQKEILRENVHAVLENGRWTPNFCIMFADPIKNGKAIVHVGRSRSGELKFFSS